MKMRKLQFSFLPIPEELMESKAISWGAKHLWGIYAKANMEKVKWSATYLAKRMKCDVREARRRKAELIKSNLIIVNPRKGRVDEVTINFELVNLVQEKTPDQTTRGRTGQGRGGRTSQGNSKEDSIKEKSVAPEVATIYPPLIDKFLKAKQRHIQIIGIWIQENGISLPNKDVADSILKRNLRPARLLVGYKNEDIVETINILKNTDYLHKFTLETVLKYIDEVVAQKKQEGPKIIRFEQIKKPDGHVVMRPIYKKGQKIK